MLEGLIDKVVTSSESAIQQVRKLSPLHLATTYLDGSKVCCEIVGILLFSDWELNYRSSDVNNLGHTVFDNLMITILKSHTAVTPEAFDDSLRGEIRFPGEEVDICGRWDADSECIRALIATGTPSVPFAWKHKFCHTSVQAVCHSMSRVVGYSRGASDDTILKISSGLFLKHCELCGLKMQLLPLHSLVLTALKLSEYGTKDEDLFGILAVLLCMLDQGADPLLVVEMSMLAYFDGDESQMGCSHENIRPAELAAWLRTKFRSQWPRRIRTGWDILCCVLRLSEKEWQTGELPLAVDQDYDYDYAYYYGACRTAGKSYFGRSTDLKILHAAVETELLTYRCLGEGNPWVSPHFSMIKVSESLGTEGGVSIGLVENNMMFPIHACGHFKNDRKVCQLNPRAEHVMRHHFSNLEDWSRTTFI